MAPHFMLLILALCALSVYADVYVSIDCGFTGSVYTDENLLMWTGDNDYISNGETHSVQSSNSISQIMDTLRVFTSRKKNCYAIPAEKGGQVLVRASFYYGNYDKKSSPPSFDLQFDGNHWDTVETSSDQVVSYEAIYVVKGNTISVCVAQTKDNQYPFMSALEVRSLKSDMYGHVDSEFALFLNRRVAYGADAIVRYADDVYDRIWAPSVVGNGLIKATGNAFLYIDASTAQDNPPQSALTNGITTSTTSDSISLGMNFRTTEYLVYINWYFAELTQLESGQSRSFQIYKDNQPYSDPILPPYGNVSEMYVTNLTVTSNTTFSLVATSGSTLPPLINAMEIFYISNQLTDGTDSNDVNGLASLQEEFEVLQEWSGDPCLPASFTWDWVNCSAGATPRVTALYLGSFGLSGPLPDLSSMDALETIDMHNNSLVGPIPDFLGTLPNLKQLNLADNQFSGPIPSSLSNNNKITLVVTGNPDVCASGGSCKTINTPVSAGSNPVITSSGANVYRKKKKSKLPVILGSIIPIFVVFWAIVGTLTTLHHKRKTAAVAAGQSGGANKPSGTPQGTGVNPQAVFNEIRVNMEEPLNMESHADQRNEQEPYHADNEGRNA